MATAPEDRDWKWMTPDATSKLEDVYGGGWKHQADDLLTEKLGEDWDAADKPDPAPNDLTSLVDAKVEAAGKVVEGVPDKFGAALDELFGSIEGGEFSIDGDEVLALIEKVLDDPATGEVADVAPAAALAKLKAAVAERDAKFDAEIKKLREETDKDKAELEQIKQKLAALGGEG